jgi:hypothetical protein
MSLRQVNYDVVVFAADADLRAGAAALSRVASLAACSLHIKGLRFGERLEVKDFRKRRYTDAALKKCLEFSEGSRAYSIYVFDSAWSEGTLPGFFGFWSQNLRRAGQGFFLASFSAGSAPASFLPTGRDLFNELGGKSGGFVSCPYILEDGTSLEWADRNNLGRDGEPAWRFPFRERWMPPN